MIQNTLTRFKLGGFLAVLSIFVALLFTYHDVFAQTDIYLPIVAGGNNHSPVTATATLQPTPTTAPTPTPTNTPIIVGEVQFDNFPSESEADFFTATAWDHADVTYFFVNGTNDITGDAEHDAVRDAFAIWERASNLRFVETNIETGSDIRISWVDTDDHGDNCDFNLNTLAHAFFPPPDTTCEGQRIDFNDQKNWMVAQDTNLTDNTYDVMAVALHEIGHTIGLYHNEENRSIVMYPSYQGLRALNADDIAAVTFLYGATQHVFRHGDIISLKTLGHIDGPRWLDGRTGDGTVGLVPNLEAALTGTRWQVFDEDNDGIVSLKCLGHIDGPRWLDGRTGDGTVGLAYSREYPITGTAWRVFDLGNGEIALITRGHIDGPRWLDGRTGDGTVGLAYSREYPITGTKWQVIVSVNNSIRSE